MPNSRQVNPRGFLPGFAWPVFIGRLAADPGLSDQAKVETGVNGGAGFFAPSFECGVRKNKSV